MGIPSYFSFIIKNYQNTIIKHTELFNNTSTYYGETPIQYNCDKSFNLFIDANSIIYDSIKDIDFSNHKVSISNSKFTHKGIGSNVLGDPRIALTWLVNELSQNNILLEKDMIVSTGTCSKPIPIAKGDIVTANFGELGEISLNLK